MTMDNNLTPNKIQRLIHLAEDKSFNYQRRLIKNEDMESISARSQKTFSQSGTNCESSGILDLDRVEGFGESGFGSISLSKSSAFNPGEMTGRSTEEANAKSHDQIAPWAFEEYGKHSVSLDSLTSHMDKQTSEIQDLMRQSIATSYSFHSKRDLTADEASFILREAPLPIQHSTQVNLQDSTMLTGSNMSAYFKNRCPAFGTILGKTESPNRPSITEVSSCALLETTQNNPKTCRMDQTLDCVPVRQPRNEIAQNLPNAYNVIHNKADYTVPKSLNMDVTANKINNTTLSKAPVASVVNKTFNQNQNPKSFMCSSNPKDVLLRKLHTSLRLQPDDTECSMENSLSISRIADYLGKESNVSVSEMLQLNNKTKQAYSKQPLTELHMNIFENKNLNKELYVTNVKNTETGSTYRINNTVNTGKLDNKDTRQGVYVTNLGDTKKEETATSSETNSTLTILDNKVNKQGLYVTDLIDSKNSEMASSSGTVDTVISLEKLKIFERDTVPKVVVTHSLNIQNNEGGELISPKATRSNSPSGRSHSTFTTVQENNPSFKSATSPLSSSKGDVYSSRSPSPNAKYRELDKSVDWNEVLNQKRFHQQSLAKEQWAEIATSSVEGFVGVSVPVTISVTTQVDSWLTAKFEIDQSNNLGSDLTVELPRFPLLLSPRKTEKFTIHITSNVEMDRVLPFTMHLKDSSIATDIEQKGNLEVNFKLPAIQSLSCDGVNKINFPTVHEKTSVTKHLVLISDCSVDLQLELSMAIGDSVFIIKSVQEIRKNDVSKVLMERSGVMEDGQVKIKKGVNKQLCRLSSGNAIKVAITFSSPNLSELELDDRMATFNGTLNVNLIGVNTVLKKVTLTGSVGSANLVVQPPVGKLQLSNEPTILNLSNVGTVTGTWAIKFRNKTGTDGQFPFKVSTNRIEIRPGSVNQLKLVYFGPPDKFNQGTLILEDTANGNSAEIDIIGGSDRPKHFPIKTNYNNMSWARAGRKELSLKNSTNQKIQIRCQIMGEGFMLDSPGLESRGTYVLSFGPCECRPLAIVFAPNSCLPHAAALHLVFDKNSDYSRKIKLHGCASNDIVRWSGLMTYGDTALVRAVSRTNIDLDLFNKANAPAFVAAGVHFNLQYRFIAAECSLVGHRRVVGRRAPHCVSLRVPWPKLERRVRACDATALATITVLTGPEYNRRRILRILKSESNGTLDVSLLPDHLKVLAEPFDGEDASMDSYLEGFNETKASLNELIEGLQELTAQIDLPQGFADDNTILITDDSVVEHHTLCD